MKFLTTYQISGEIENLIRSAKEAIALVTPYVKIRDNYIQRLRDAEERNVEIYFIFGKSHLDHSQIEKLNTIRNLYLYYLENLHAKCYISESRAIITSMNLYDYSESNNREMALLIEKNENPQLFDEINEEIQSLISSSELIRGCVDGKDNDESYCIHCRARIDFDIDKPLCYRCYNEWRKECGDPWYEEEFCHLCGERSNTNMNKPLCYNCYKRVN